MPFLLFISIFSVHHQESVFIHMSALILCSTRQTDLQGYLLIIDDHCHPSHKSIGASTTREVSFYFMTRNCRFARNFTYEQPNARSDVASLAYANEVQVLHDRRSFRALKNPRSLVSHCGSRAFHKSSLNPCDSAYVRIVNRQHSYIGVES